MKKKVLLILGAIAIATILTVNVTLIAGNNNSKLLFASLLTVAKADGEDCGWVVNGSSYTKIVNGQESVCTPIREACTGETGESCVCMEDQCWG